jgi:hypothetical protein
MHGLWRHHLPPASGRIYPATGNKARQRAITPAQRSEAQAVLTVSKSEFWTRAFEV